jgi:cytochrome c556
VRDNWAEKEAAGLSKISNKFYKKSLKPFLEEEKPEIWERLDKFHFNEQVVVEAINEFNQNFSQTAN